MNRQQTHTAAAITDYCKQIIDTVQQSMQFTSRINSLAHNGASVSPLLCDCTAMLVLPVIYSNMTRVQGMIRHTWYVQQTEWRS